MPRKRQSGKLPVAKSRKDRTHLNIPPIETIPDLGVSPEAAKLIRVAVWLEQGVKEISRYVEGVNLKGSDCEYYRDNLGRLAFDFWIGALSNISGPDKIAMEMIVAAKKAEVAQ